MILYACNDKKNFYVSYLCPFSKQLCCQYLPKSELTLFISIYGSSSIIDFIWY